MSELHHSEAPDDRTAEQIVAADAASAKYDPDSVQIYKGTAHIRERPSMYIGDTGHKGLHHLVYELVYNSVDEALAGHCKTIDVIINPDSSLTVRDDGRGIPVEMHPKEMKPTLEVVMTTVGAGAKFDKKTYKVSAGLHGIGAKAVTALSEWVEAEVRRGGKVYAQEYERGQPITPVQERGIATRTGTRITFHPDPEIFGEATFEYGTLEGRLRELAFLNKGLHIVLHDERHGKKDDFKYDGGIAEFVEYLNRTEEVLHKPIYIEKVVDEVRVEVALQFTRGDEDRYRCYANNAYNPSGGTHLSGMRTALTRTLGNYGTKENFFKGDLKPIGEDFREGLTSIVSVQVPEPQLEAQTKVRLNNPEVEGIVSGVVSEALAKYLEEHPKDAKKIIDQIVTSAEAREAAAKAKKALIDRKKILSGGGLPGKLFDCTNRDREGSELFLVEGDSAGGSAESGRDRKFQAILPLRGKPLNVEKARTEILLENKEISSLIAAIGIDIGNHEENEDNLKRLRYSKIILLSDADVDGQHIRTLLLTFFYRQMPQLVARGHIYVARPPLYKVTQKKHVRFVQTTAAMSEELMSRGLDGTRLTILPPASEQLTAPTTVLEGDRLAALVKVVAKLEESLVILERSGLNLTSFMQKVTDRGALPMFRITRTGKEDWFHTREDVDAWRRKQQEQLGCELVVAEESLEAHGSGTGNGQAAATYREQEMHEVRKVNKALEELRGFGLAASDLIPPKRIAGREPDKRLILNSGGTEKLLNQLRELVVEIRRLGERGVSVMRFKGLGEMDPAELWETTLDPAKRTLMQIRLEDALNADNLFRTLMGEKVEPRKEFIIKNALEVKDLDYHGA